METTRLLAGVLFCSWINLSAAVVLPDVWTVRSSPTTNQLNGVAYGNGRFVAVGSHATILLSWDGREWLTESAGTTIPTLYAATYGNGRYVVAGGEGALIRSSTDGIHWTNGLSTIGIEHLYGITYGVDEFVAVGSGPHNDTSYILTSSNGLDWISRSVPTTNRLLAVSPCYGSSDGVGWAEIFYAAVGERGTIVTSTNGVNWTLQNSGTTVNLRSVVWKGGFLVGGDSGTMLITADGTSWHAVAPTSFNVRGLASSGLSGAVVAVGNYTTSGRLHASTDGITWPGFSTEFPQPLNAVAYGSGSFVAVGDGGLIVQSSSSIVGPTNEWTKPTSGYWEEPFWSLGQLPNMDQSLVAFRNPGFKALAIGTNTTFNHALSLSLENLIVDAPPGSINQLLLNYAGVNIPLFVHSDFILGSNASLVSYHSALRGGNLYLSGPAAFSENSQITFGKLVVGANAPAELNLTNSSLSTILLMLSQGGAGTLHQSGGSNLVSVLQMNAASAYQLLDGSLQADRLDMQTEDGDGLAQFMMKSGDMNVQGPIRLGQRRFPYLNAVGEFLLAGGYLQAQELDFLNGTFTQTGGTNATPLIALPLLDASRGQYLLADGTLISSVVNLGKVIAPDTPPGSADFTQTGGVHSNSTMQLFGEIRKQTVTHYGAYSLRGGLLVSDAIWSLGGAFGQSGGTNYVRELVLDEASVFGLIDGLLVTSNTTVDTCCCVMSSFNQMGGNHTVKNRLLLQEFVRYQLLDGTLTASNIELVAGGELLVQGGVVTNSGLFTFRAGTLRVGGQTQQLGQLQVIGELTGVCFSIQTAGPTLDVGQTSGDGSTVLRFRDSRDVPWSGAPLKIINWSPTTNGFGPEHIYVGTNSQGLTSAQLSQIVFVNPAGSPPGNYPAQILSTGEVIPVPFLYFTTTDTSLILSWSGIYDLLTATNVTGPYLVIPGASSPYTVLFTDPQRFFKLRAP